MNEEFLKAYSRELSHIRRSAAEFAKAHPKVAGRLRMSAEAIEDPHVSRLVESFAFLNAQIRAKLDDDFPELSTGLLEALYPHYLAPLPSMAIVQLQAKADSKNLRIPRGTMLETKPIEGQPIRFQTVYDTPLAPVQVTMAQLYHHRRAAPNVSNNLGVKSVVRLTLKTMDKSPFSTAAPDLCVFI